ncbi:MAG: tetratricopeptide repeat protein [Candidatus Berkiella sp.]
MSLSRPLTLNNLPQHLLKANELRQKKDLPGALAIIKDCLNQFPQDPNVQCLWAVIQIEQKNYEVAEKAINTAIALNPNVGDFYYVLGQLQRQTKHFNEAENALLHCVKLNPSHEKAYFQLASLYESQKRYPESIQKFNKVLSINPNNAKAYYNLGVIYHLQNKLDEAIANYEKAYQLMPDELQLLSNYGAALTMDKQLFKAIPYFERALDLSPDYIPAISNLAGTYIELEELKKAETLLRRSLKLNSRLPTNWRNLTLCRQYELLNDPDLVKILELTEEEISTEDRIHYDFALGKIYHDCKDYQNAFFHYERGNQQQALKVRFESENFARHVQQILKTDEELLNDSFHFANEDGPTPLIIAGSSRTGKSLIESILKQNPEIAAQGEVGIVNLVDKMPFNNRPKSSYPYWLKTMTPKQATLLRELYLQRLKRNGDNEVQYLTDTMPGNFMYLGLIKALFPKAKFIYCQRDPLDTCALLYFKFFIQGHAYSYDLEKIASFYQQQALLMEHWQAKFGSEILTIQYEELVKAPEKTMSHIADFLGLDKHFVFNCANVNANEVGIFKHYSKPLESMAKALNIPVVVQEEQDATVHLKAMMGKAYYHYNLGEFEAAEALCETILQEDPKHIGALHLAGVSAFKLSQYDKALDLLKVAVKYSSPNAQLHLDLGSCLQKMGKPKLAKQQFKIVDALKKESYPSQEKRDEKKQAVLLSAFKSPPKVISEVNNKLLVQGLLETSSTESFTESNNSQDWDILFKNHAVAHQILTISQKTLRLLDVGCANGSFLNFLLEKPHKQQLYYWGIDKKEELLKEALKEQNSVPCLFTMQDVQNGLPYRNSFFDFIVNLSMIQYLSIEQGQLLLAELYRVLKPEGYLAISARYQAKHPGFMQSVPQEQFKVMLKENGFEIEASYGAGLHMEKLLPKINKNHKALVESLLEIHPPDIVVALIAPLYPKLANSITYLCKIR